MPKLKMKKEKQADASTSVPKVPSSVLEDVAIQHLVQRVKAVQSDIVTAEDRLIFLKKQLAFACSELKNGIDGASGQLPQKSRTQRK